MRATLFAVPASHPSLAAELVLRHKGVDYRRVDLVTAAHRGLVRAIGFPGKGAKLGIPTSMGARTSAPIAAAARRVNRATDEAAERDLAALPGMIDRVDELIERGVIGGSQRNAADFQIATSLSLLLTMDDVRPMIERRPAERLARDVVPHQPRHMPRVFAA